MPKDRLNVQEAGDHPCTKCDCGNFDNTGTGSSVDCKCGHVSSDHKGLP